MITYFLGSILLREPVLAYVMGILGRGGEVGGVDRIPAELQVSPESYKIRRSNYYSFVPNSLGSK